MAEVQDILSISFDYKKTQEDANKVLASLKSVLDYADKLNNIGDVLKGGVGFSGSKKGADEINKALGDVTKVYENYKKEVISAEKVLQEEARTRAANLKVKQEEAKVGNEIIKQLALESKAEQEQLKAQRENNKVKQEEVKADQEIVKQIILETKAQQEQIRLKLENARAEAELARVKVEEARAAKELAKQKQTDVQTSLTLSKEQERQQKQADKAAEAAQKLIEKQAKAAADAANEYKKLSQAYNAAALEAKNFVLTLGADHPVAIQAVKDARAMADQLLALDRSVGQSQRNVGNYPTVLSEIGHGFKDLVTGGLAAIGVVGVVDTIANALGGIFNLNKELETSVQNLSAITGAAGNDLKVLRDAAIDLSTQGAGSAKDYIEAMKLIASAKPELLTAKDDLIEVTKAAKLLGEASGLELPDAATRLTDALNQFGEPASRASVYVDALAAAAKFGAAEVPEVTDALLKFGAVAKSSNIDIFESSAAIELLAEKGMKGADAGVALRNAFTKLSAVEVLPKAALAQLAAAGVNTDILKDKSKSLQERLTELSKIKNNDNALTKVFGVENLVAGQVILQNIPRFAELTKQIKENGIALEQATANTDTIAFKWEKLKNVFAAPFIDGGESAKGVKRFLDDLVNGIDTFGIGMDRVVLKVKDGFASAFAGIKNGLSDLKGIAMLDFSGVAANQKQREQERVINEQRKKDALDLAQVRVYAESVVKSASKEKIEDQKKLLHDNEELLKGSEAVYKQLRDQGKASTAEGKNAALQFIKDATIVEKLRVNIAKAEAEAKKEAPVKNAVTNGGHLSLNPKPQKDYLDDVIKAQNEAKKFLLEAQRDLNKSIVDDDKLSYTQRLMALESYNSFVVQLLEVDKENALRANKEKRDNELKQAGLTAKQRAQIARAGAIEQHNIESKFAVDLQKTRLDQAKQLEDFEKNDQERQKQTRFQTIAERQKALYDENQQRIKDRLDADTHFNELIGTIDAAASANEQQTLLDKYAKGKISKEQYEKELFDIQLKYAQKAIKLQIDTIEQELKAANLDFETRKKLEQQLAELKLKFSQGALTTAEKNREEIVKEIQTIQEKFNQVADVLGGAISISVTKQKNALQDLEDEQQKNYQNEVERVQSSSLTEAEKADRLKVLEAQRQAQKETFDRKNREADHKKAEFDKATSIANIIFNTAAAVVKALPNVLLATLVGALGAAQLAVAIATPIPKYAKGVKDKQESGLGIYGEAGPELIEKPGHKPFIATSETLDFLPKGTNITPITNNQINQIMYRGMMKQTASTTAAKTDKSDMLLMELIKETRKNNSKKVQVNARIKFDTTWETYKKNYYS